MFQLVSSQQNLATGGAGSGTGGSSGASASLVSYEVTEIEGMDTEKNSDLFVWVLPGEVTDFLHVRIEADQYEGIKFQLSGYDGQPIKTGKIHRSKTKIFVGNLPASTYTLKISGADFKNKTFRIIKN
jgi:hypothetical protein